MLECVRREMIMFGRTQTADTDHIISKAHFFSVIMAQMTAYCQRYMETKLIENNGPDGQHHNADVYFIFKQILLCMNSGVYGKCKSCPFAIFCLS
jgi:hypothetical protein